MQHRGLVSSQPPRPGATAVCRLAQRGEPDIVLSRERDQIACNVRVAQVTRLGHAPTLSVHRRDQRRRTRYTVSRDSQFRHPAQEGLRVGPFLALLAAADENDSTTPRAG